MTTLATLTTRTPALPCRLDPDAWYSDNAHTRDAAARLCRTCPLLLPCADYALREGEEYGVWGGLNAAERRTLQDGRPRRFDELGRVRLVCGSVSAYHAHFTYGEQPCEECTAAWDEQLLADRRARLEVEHAKGGSSTGYHLHRRIGEPACEVCLGAMRRQSAATRRARAGRRLQRPRTPSGTSGATGALSGPQTGAQPLPIAS